MPEDLRFKEKSSNRERSSSIFNVFSDVTLICAFRLLRYSIEKSLPHIYKLIKTPEDHFTIKPDESQVNKFSTWKPELNFPRGSTDKLIVSIDAGNNSAFKILSNFFT